MKTSNKISLLIRHADRDEIPKGSFGNEVLLNEKGKQNAEIFGRNLSETKINKIFTSPVERCIQTAQYIEKGYGKNLEIIESIALGNPGIPIYDDKLTGDYFMQYGGFTMYEHFIQGKTIPGVLTIEEIQTTFTRFLSDNTTENGLTIFISHDMTIAMYHYAINKTKYTKDNWIDFLSGITLKNGNYEG